MKEKIIKSDIIDKISDMTNYHKPEIRTVLDSFICVVQDYLLENKIIEIRGFGTLQTKTHKPFETICPVTGKKIHVPINLVPVFRFSKVLRKKIKESMSV